MSDLHPEVRVLMKSCLNQQVEIDGYRSELSTLEEQERNAKASYEARMQQCINKRAEVQKAENRLDDLWLKLRGFITPLPPIPLDEAPDFNSRNV